MRIVLLDLNYTLVENSRDIRGVRPFQRKIGLERYRGWLLDLLTGSDVKIIMVTARPQYQEAATRASLREKLNWEPDESYFMQGSMRPEQWKEIVLRDYLLPKYGDSAEFVAWESNPRTRKMYARHGVPSMQVSNESPVEPTVLDPSQTALF